MADHDTGGMRFATAVDLLSSLNTPVIIVDNTGRSACWSNPAFKKLCQRSNTSPETQQQEEQADFLQTLQDAPSSSSQEPASVSWRGASVLVAWEHAIQGEDIQAPTVGEDSSGKGDEKACRNDSGTEGIAMTDSLIYLPLLGHQNDDVTTSALTPLDQGLSRDNDLDVQLERTVWQCLLKEIPAACLVLDKHGKVRFASRTLNEVFHTEHDVKEWDNVSSLPDGCEGILDDGSPMSAEDYPLYRTVTHHQVIRGLEYKVRHGNGSEGGIRSTSSPIFDNNGEVVAFVAIIEDVTSTYDARRERDSLRAQHEATQRANKLKDQFINAISHELRTPINGLVGLQDLIHNETDVSEQRRYFRQVFHLSERLKTVVDDLLACSLSEGQIEAEVTPGSMEDMIKEVLHGLSNAARHKGVHLSLQPPVEPDFPKKILTDCREFKNVIHRLVDNAIKFSKSGGSAHVSLELQKEESSYFVVIRVTDEGCGMRDTDKVFEAFSQEEHSISRTESGLGLGLAYVKSAVRRMGGKVDVTSELGEGSIFSLYFPLALEPTSQPPQTAPALVSTQKAFLHRRISTKGPEGQPDPAATDNAAGHAVISGKPSEGVAEKTPEHRLARLGISDIPKKILIVEDEPINAKILERTFSKAGFEVTWAQNGKEGCDHAEKQRFSCVIMDINMPVMSGIESTKAIRSHEAHEKLVPTIIIGFTANTASRALDDSIAAGMTMLITKPRTGKQVLDIVNQQLKA